MPEVRLVIEVAQNLRLRRSTRKLRFGPELPIFEQELGPGQQFRVRWFQVLLLVQIRAAYCEAFHANC
jgi:hypothetical protein